MAQNFSLDDIKLISSLSQDEQKLLIGLLESGEQLVDLRLATELSGDEDVARRTLSKLTKRGWLEKSARGLFTISHPYRTEDAILPVEVLATNNLPDSYVAWGTAANHHGLTNQQSQAVQVATVKQVPKKFIDNREIHYMKVTKTKFFGAEPAQKDGYTFKISNPAKTVIDCVDRPETVNGLAGVMFIVQRASKKLSEYNLIDAAIKHGSVSVVQRLGFFMDLVAPDFWSDRGRAVLRSRISPSARSNIGRLWRQEGDIGFISDWSVLVNISRAELMALIPEDDRPVELNDIEAPENFEKMPVQGGIELVDGDDFGPQFG